MAAHNTPRHAPTDTSLNPVEMRLLGGMLALNRFLMTLQNKRMPVASFTVGRDGGGGMRATILLDCSPETARRYTTLLSALEDVEEIEATEETMEVALIKAEDDGWRGSAARAGIGLHEDGETIVVSGEPFALDAWLAEAKDSLQDVVRLGPLARPGDGGA